jgi:O-methyltransferase involved in polyketide biosynthesis
MVNKQEAAPDNTAVRTALWRALHVEIDSPPHVFEDVLGLQLAVPDDDWRSRPDMSPFTRPFRASIVARARFVEDVVAEEAARGVEQYVILGAGLDTFAQRRSDLTSQVRVFEMGSARTAGMEATATRRTWLRCAVVLATRADGF